VELHRDDVVLARRLWWRGRARSELPTVRPKAAAAALVGGALVSYGEACARVDWDGGGLVMAAHGRAVRDRSKRRRRRWNVGQVLKIGYWDW
jgi:hypothetical protein